MIEESKTELLSQKIVKDKKGCYCRKYQAHYSSPATFGCLNIKQVWLHRTSPMLLPDPQGQHRKSLPNPRLVKWQESNSRLFWKWVNSFHHFFKPKCQKCWCFSFSKGKIAYFSFLTVLLIEYITHFPFAVCLISYFYTLPALAWNVMESSNTNILPRDTWLVTLYIVGSNVNSCRVWFSSPNHRNMKLQSQAPTQTQTQWNRHALTQDNTQERKTYTRALWIRQQINFY